MLENFLFQIKKPYHFVKTGLRQGLLSQFKYNFPEKKIKIIAITGTDGKTTTVSLLHHIFNSANHKTAMITTVNACISQKKISTGLHTTTPNPDTLRKLIKKMVDQKNKYLILELTAHGSYQYRDWGLKPKVVGITNITHEHLDYFVNMPNYIKAKANIANKAQKVFINKDDSSYYQTKQQLKNKRSAIIDFSLTEKINPAINKAIKKRLPEPYNQSNARLAVKIAQEYRIKNNTIAKAIINFPGVVGRMQEVDIDQNFNVIVDYAHTPNGIKESLTALRHKLEHQKKEGKPGRLIAVYGCTGLRDVEKRPMMGKIGSELADLAIFTADDSRTEDTWTIIRQMKEGLKSNHHKIVSIADRKKALKFTLKKIAKAGDIIALLGQGHEQSLCIGKTEIPWNDADMTKKILSEK